MSRVPSLLTLRLMPGTLWATAFHDPCVELLGMTGEEMHTLEQKAATAEESQADLDARLLANHRAPCQQLLPQPSRHLGRDR